MRLSPGFLLAVLSTSTALASENPLWLRYPAISPEGQTIAFSWKGDIYSVPAVGGRATPLTLSESDERMPVWSHDGTRIAFVSDRFGNYDVFVMPAGGGEAKRLTCFSGNEIPSTFSVDDKAVLFSTYRQQAPSDAQFPSGLLPQLYSVGVSGGRVSQVLPSPALDAQFDSTGGKLIFHDIKGYESPWRKHHTSSVARDLWCYDFKEKKYRQLTTFKGEDRNPVFGANDNDYYYLSEENGSFNVFKSSLSDPGKTQALTHFTNHPVRFLTRATNDTLCFSYDGEIYTLRPGDDPGKVPINIGVDGRDSIPRIVPVNDGFTEVKLSPNGKEFAYVFHGEIFVSSVEGGLTKRLTDTPWQERSVNFSQDGRSLVFAAEKDNNWNVYSLTIPRKDEPYFYAATELKQETVVATPEEEFQPAFSPDGKEVAYLENRVVLKVIQLATRKARTILPAKFNYSYADNDQYYCWSPDGKWFLVQFAYPERIFTPQVGLVAADGNSEVHNLTLSGYENIAPKWVLEGKALIWGSNREGTRQQSGGLASADVYGLFLTRAAFDRFKLTKEEFALVKEREDKEEKDKKEPEDAKKAGAKADKQEDKPKEVAVDWENLPERKSKLTIHTSPASDWVLSKDGEKLYYLTRFDKGNELWMTELRTRETKLFSKLAKDASSLQISADGKFLVLLAEGKPMKVEIEGGKSETLKTSGEMMLRPAEERAYIFDHAWRQFKAKFYMPELAVDWDFYYSAYKKFLPFINNNHDFAEMLSEMLGEVNVSHTGCRYRPKHGPADETAELGVLVDFGFTGAGVKVAEVLEGGPLDKASSRIRAGHVIEAIDGQPITADKDFSQLLNRRDGQLTLISVFDPAQDSRWEETVKPIGGGEVIGLLYKRWVKNRRKEVAELSQGKIGYIHVKAMDDASMRTVFEEALGRNVGKQALIIDTRFNGGGDIHEQLSDFLSGRKYFDIIPHGQHVGVEPYDKWIKPSIVLVGEGNYSDAHLFPMAYKLKHIGKTLGMPVPGTGTFVWWEAQIDPSLVFGIPMGGWRAPDGKFCENNQMEPDIQVRNDPASLASGHDQQLAAAVAELLR